MPIEITKLIINSSPMFFHYLYTLFLFVRNLQNKIKRDGLGNLVEYI